MRMVSILGGMILGLAGLTAGMVKLQEAYGLFYPRTYPREQLERLPSSHEFVTFPSRDDTKLTGVFKPGDSSKSPAVLFAHGNAGHMLDRLPWFRTALPDGWTGLMLDYRGYGLSDGTPSVEGVKEDVRSAAEYLEERTASNQLYLHGRSLGVPLVAYASQFVQTDGMILESGFPDAGSVARELFTIPGIQFLVSIDLNTVTYLRQAQNSHGSFPKLILHGSNDGVLPVELGRSLHEQTPDPREWWLVKGAGHNNLTMVAGDAYRKKLVDFLRSAAND